MTLFKLNESAMTVTEMLNISIACTGMGLLRVCYAHWEVFNTKYSMSVIV